MFVEATAPSRIDLAGGTLDIYPLYLFEEGGLTVNIGIDVASRVRLTPRPDRAIRIRSLDTGLDQEADRIEELELGGPLDLVARLLRFYPPAGGVDVDYRKRVSVMVRGKGQKDMGCTKATSTHTSSDSGPGQRD